MSNDFFDVAIESDYRYLSGDSQKSLFYDLERNIVNFQAFFQNGLETGAIISEDLDLIAKEMENTAKRFAVAQGLGPGGGGTSLVVYGKDGTTSFIPSKISGPTGNLYYHIKAVRENEKITLKNDAKNFRGQYYAGHIEFGFRARNGKMIPARPFMRPALYAVADASKGQISGTLKRYLEQVWALETLQFGSLNISRGRVRPFYSLAMNPQAKGYGMYTATKLPQGRLNQLSSKEGRLGSTVYRNMKDSFSQRVGSRMGHGEGGRYLTNTRWYNGNEKTSVSSKNSYQGTTKPISTKTSSQTSSGKTNTYGSRSDYNSFKHFAETHFGGNMRAAKESWSNMK